MSARADAVLPAGQDVVMAGTAAARRMVGLAPEQVAFLGDVAEKNIFVQTLCWPTIPAAWSMLAEMAAAMRSVRDGLLMSNLVVGSSWVQQVAPQLSGPLEREWSAVESTLATVIRRLPVRFAVAIVEHDPGERQGTDSARYRSLFAGCLTAYDTYLKSSNQTAFQLMLAPSHGNAINELRQSACCSILPHIDGSSRLGELELAFWPKTQPPLPMEVAQLAAAAVGRHLQDPAQHSPVFEAVQAQLAPPSHFHGLRRKSTRR